MSPVCLIIDKTLETSRPSLSGVNAFFPEEESIRCSLLTVQACTIQAADGRSRETGSTCSVSWTSAVFTCLCMYYSPGCHQDRGQGLCWTGTDAPINVFQLLTCNIIIIISRRQLFTRRWRGHRWLSSSCGVRVGVEVHVHDVERRCTQPLAGDHFQLQMNPRSVLSWLFLAAGRWMWDWLKINESDSVRHGEGTCQAGRQCGSLVFNNGATLCIFSWDLLTI